MKNGEYDLERRLAKLAGDIIEFTRTILLDSVNRRIIEQLIGAAGSAGANYCEATEAESKKDFIHKIGIAKKELKETGHWLILFEKANPEYKEEIRRFWKEARELLLIFAKISRSSKSSSA